MGVWVCVLGVRAAQWYLTYNERCLSTCQVVLARIVQTAGAAQAQSRRKADSNALDVRVCVLFGSWSNWF
jgi:TPP-dependent pyruvate/acetoin dehydrogenase alpha subunit